MNFSACVGVYLCIICIHVQLHPEGCLRPCAARTTDWSGETWCGATAEQCYDAGVVLKCNTKPLRSRSKGQKPKQTQDKKKTAQRIHKEKRCHISGASGLWGHFFWFLLALFLVSVFFWLVLGCFVWFGLRGQICFSWTGVCWPDDKTPVQNRAHVLKQVVPIMTPKSLTCTHTYTM